MSNSKNGVFRRIIDDLCQKELLSLKVIFFVHSSTVFVLYPYLTLHMRELGINVEETAIMSALAPLLAIMMPPVAGMAADRIGNFKFLLAIFSGLGGLSALLLLLIPAGRVTIPFSENMVLGMRCSSNSSEGYFNFDIAEGEMCLKMNDSVLETNGNRSFYTDVSMSLESCGVICPLSTAIGFSHSIDDENSIDISDVKGYNVLLTSANESIVETHSYNISSKDFSLPWFIPKANEDVRSFSTQKKSKNFKSSVQAFSNEYYFFPTPELFNINCKSDNCLIKKTNSNDDESSNRKKFVFKHFYPKVNNADKKIEGFSYESDLNNPNQDTIETCVQENWKSAVEIFTHNRNDENLEADVRITDCETRCIMKTARKTLCSNPTMVNEYNPQFTFWSYLTIRVFIGVISGTGFAMYEGAVIAILREQKADYGLQRIYASVGGMIASPLSGVMIDYYSRGKGYTDFRPAFYIYGGLKVISAALMLTLSLEFKPSAKSVFRELVAVLKQIEIIALLFTCLIMGTAWGYIESFLFWLLQDLGATRSLMGLTITVAGIAGLPLLAMSGPIIENIGHANVIFIGFIFYAIRLVGYSMITEAWQCLIFEAMESVTSSLAYTAAVTYAAKLSNTRTDSSVQGLLGGLYFGVGKGTGSLSGGYLIKYFGSRNTYRIFAAVTLATGIAYYFFNRFYVVGRHSSNQDREIEKSKNGTVEKSNGVIPQEMCLSEVNKAFEEN